MQAPPVNAASEAAADPVDLANDPIPSFASLQAARGTVFRTRRSLDSFGMQIDALGREGEEGRRRGLGLWMVGRYEEAVEMLEAHSADDVASFTHANALMSLGRPAEAVGVFQRLSEAYADEPRPRAGWIEARLEAVLAETGDRDQAADAAAASCAEAPESFMASADGLYIQGRISELRRDRETAIDHYSAAREADPTHRRNLFRLAHLCERWGLDEQALEAYEGLAAIQPIDRKVLLNLGCLYEDLGRDQDAATCYDTVVRFDPTDRRARLYLEDARAGMDMYYDEDLERKEDRLNQILRIPITDFELSVRARNCLNKMSILTLGDLVTKTETELLSYKNFGETSLNEIKEILGSKALRLGMDREEAVDSISQVGDAPPAPSGATEVENTPLAELNLSIRARRAVESMGCLTAGDIARRHEEEFTTQPNFGTTSLQELRQKLSDLGLSLKTRS
ncbi:MAG: DNA-directed RNA polymerase subunit alpha C-terminal domain-containing protein [Planctomycetota bacterium]|nr:DNA-directed RNA polymerase subunit alpha C-terminal domain-containing protein [Planctomycetota bacterium]